MFQLPDLNGKVTVAVFTKTLLLGIYIIYDAFLIFMYYLQVLFVLFKP